MSPRQNGCGFGQPVKDVLMRIQPWMKAVTGAALMLGAQASASAQQPIAYGQPAYAMPEGATYPLSGAGGYYGSPGPGGYQAPSPAMPGGPADPATLWPAGTPAGFQPWPEISPFQAGNVGQTQHYNDNGLWFKEMFYRQRKYYGSFEFMAFRPRDVGNGTIGSPYAKALYNDPSIAYPYGMFQSPLYGPFVESPNVDPAPIGNFVIDPRVIPYPALSDSAYTDSASPAYFPIRSGNTMPAPDPTLGLTGRLGYMNEDYTGTQATVWWAFDTGSNFTRGYEYINGVKVNQNITTVLEGQNLTTLGGNIPLYNGEDVAGPSFGLGSTAKYDVLYSLTFETQAGGGNVSFYQQPAYRNNGIMIRPLWGLRYMYLAERFAFRGIDSGFNYSVDEETFRPDSIELLYDQYEANLSNSIKSNIAGPEVGFRIDLGQPNGRGFRMWTETILGIAANHQQFDLAGDNIGDPLVDVRFKGYLVPRILDDANYNSAFSQSKSSTHVSPVFQQSIFADFNILDTVPVIREMELFEHARLRVGWTFTFVGEVARPIDSIKWQGFPLFPEIRERRESWWANQLNVGFDWNF
ncbi:hypothetical protein [Planctomicrobium sp. SH664]|uniref:hypothetical protein n=1 Tax=Planctomicrobium sp. SH664 TaxID=3448125 RepID=UPI003F5BA549